MTQPLLPRASRTDSGLDARAGRAAWRSVGEFALVGLASIAAVAMGTGLAAPGELAATGGGTQDDFDGDGLLDVLEALLGTEPLLADTDADLVGDLEELARGSDPNEITSVPEAAGDGIALQSRVENGVLELTTMLFLDGGSLTGKNLRLRLASSALNAPVELNTAEILAISNVDQLAGMEPGDKLLTIETPLPEYLLAALGGFTIVGVIEGVGGGPITAAASQTYVLTAGVLNSVKAVPSSAGQGPGLTYQPLTPPEALPETYEPQKVCVQSTSAAGSSGSVVTYVIDSSDCVEADGFCSPLCSAKTGSTIDLIDPLVLIGG